MISVDLRALIGKLNAQCRDALQAAIGLAVSRTHYAVEVEHWLVKAADAEKMTLHSEALAEDGQLLHDEGDEVNTWSDLMKHATFPAALTTRSEGHVSVPAGEFDSIDYEIHSGAQVKRFHFARQLPGPPVLMEVEDEGGGFPAASADDLFRPFEQRGADRTGLGLGLAFSRWGVEAHHGRIYARNLPGQGCIFTVDLPRLQVSPVATV